MNALRTAWQIGILAYLTAKSLWEHRKLGQRDFVRQVLMQVYFTGVQASGTVAILAIGVGVFAVIATTSDVATLSGSDTLGRTVTEVILREVAPLLTGGVIIVRSVSAIAAEIAVMRVQLEFEALEVMGIPPLRQLIAPRVIGGTLSAFGLNVLFDAVALIGGYLGALFIAPVPAGLFVGAALSATTPADLVAFFMKVVVGSIGIFLIGCYEGMNAESSSTEIPVAVSKASLHSLIFLLSLQAAVSIVMLLLSFRGASSIPGMLP